MSRASPLPRSGDRSKAVMVGVIGRLGVDSDLSISLTERAHRRMLCRMCARKAIRGNRSATRQESGVGGLRLFRPVATISDFRRGRHAPNARSTALGGKQQMANDNRTKIIPRRTPGSAAMSANLERAMAITATLNRLTFNDADEVRSLFSDLIGKNVDDSFLLIPPFYTTGGVDISVGRNVLVNQNCTFYDLGGLEIADDSAGAASIRV
jgi:hypothetical protein